MNASWVPCVHLAEICRLSTKFVAARRIVAVHFVSPPEGLQFVEMSRCHVSFRSFNTLSQ